MKLLTSVVLASAAVEARQRREGDMGHGDMPMEPMAPGPVVDHGDMNHGDMMTTTTKAATTTTTEHMMHSTTTHAPHTTHAHTTHAHTTHAPHTEKPHVEEHHEMPKPCEGQRCGCNAEEMMRWKNEMREWKHDQEKWQFEFRHWMQEYGTDNDWDHADFGPGFDWDASWGEQNMGGDINIDQGMAWQFAQWLTQADQICPLMNLLQLGDLGLPKNMNLQDECRFQARQLAGFVELFSHLPTMNNHYTNSEWSNYMCNYVTDMISAEMNRYGFNWMSHTPHFANDACSCLTNIFMDAAEGDFNVMNLGMCAMNVQSLITNAMQFDWELKTYAPEAIAEYVVAIGNYMTENAIEIDWTNENFGKLFMVWGFPKLDLTDVDAVYNAIANAWAWNVSMKTGASLDMFFDLFINVDTYVDFIFKRMAAFGVNIDNAFEVGVFLSDEKNQNRLLDMKAIDGFVMSFFKDPEFVNKLAAFVGTFDLSVYGEGWSIANWFNANFANWDQEGWTYPSITASLELFNFFNDVVMLQFAGLDWSAAFVMNLINCASMDDINTLFTNGGWEAWLTGLATDDLDKFRCIARVPRNMNLFAIEAGMFNINANGLTFFEQIDFSNFFNIDFSVGFTGFDLASFAAMDAATLAAIDFAGFNTVLEPFFGAFEIFNSMGVFNFDVTAIDATNILNFNLDNIANAFEQVAMFFLKYEFQDKDFKSVMEFTEAVTAWMNDFIYWFNNLGAWVDSVNARKEYYFGQLGWELGNAENEASWAIWAANPTNWGQLIYGSRSWKKFQDIMDLMHAEMNEDDKWMQSTMAWMQFLSGQTVDDFDFSEWAMNGMENGFGYESETGFWTVMNTYYRDFFAEFGFFDEYMEGAYDFNAGGVIATAACMQFTDFTPQTINFDVNPNDFGEKFDGCFYMYYSGINAEWGL